MITMNIGKTFTFIPKTHDEILKQGFSLNYSGISYISEMEEKFAGKILSFRRSDTDRWYRDIPVKLNLFGGGYLWHRYWLKESNIDKNGQYLLEGFDE